MPKKKARIDVESHFTDYSSQHFSIALFSSLTLFVNTPVQHSFLLKHSLSTLLCNTLLQDFSTTLLQHVSQKHHHRTTTTTKSTSTTFPKNSINTTAITPCLKCTSPWQYEHNSTKSTSTELTNERSTFDSLRTVVNGCKWFRSLRRNRALPPDPPTAR